MEVSLEVYFLSKDPEIPSSSLTIALLMCLQAFVMCNWTELEEEITLDSVVISLSRSSICLMSFIAVKESVTDSSPWYAVTFRVESIVKEEVTEIWRCVLESDMKWSSSSVGHQDN